ncbi:DUF5677 domain-containing protein [Aristaeella lactis]|uniref:Uncharacterized protein n=1 Tax=Aristaeella lactis TaxID=3046383 RepID=A0AC61PJ86_9FIRM|nr:DUF5677 domain-containing protein [Aristaeella lactis]QUA54032.1 hypothetical protein JYE50_05260 [Aristaeella lactis]SMC42530.1 hypothetical protein SAMN06297397_0866 [Aristaeella lactis]
MKEISIDLNELLIKEADGSLKSDDFDMLWTNIVMLPIYRIEYIINTSKHTETGYDIDQAFYYGLLNRIRAFLCYERRIVCKHLLNLELSSILNRSVLEDNITLRYFLNHPEELDDYRKSCFRAEIEFEDIIYKNRENRKEDPVMYNWEEELLRSIHRAYSTIGLNSEQIRSFRLPKSPMILDMAREVDLEIAYTSYRMECHSTHGDWFDISRYFLIEKEGKFYPRFAEDYADIRKFSPMLLLVYETIHSFINTVLGHGIDKCIEDEIQKDIIMIQKFEHMHFNYTKGRPLLFQL